MTENQGKIIELIRQFPYFFDRIPREITADFDAGAFDQWASSHEGVLADSEIIMAQFVLMVWNRYEKWKIGPFDIDQALNILSGEHKAVIERWRKKPYFL